MTIDEKGVDPLALAERMESHMGLADRADLLRDCRLAASVIRRLAYESAKQKETAGWRDIASAPKDGTNILVAAKDGLVFAVYYVQPDRDWYDEWLAQADSTGDGPVLSFATDALAYWRPLPEPPALLSTGGEG